ncbi:molybdopterin-dependent oxidoreductase [Mucilaginibacter auburnensis]|uniref:Molybdopterin-dependent oxidoreductase-like protein n=1 Tax=Mucilaginibacter auburnensis TaxID=1457233 RepID=A0A2H9VQB5_9SPHI|nr:molybdopterin-dependent oxidoreductase [Mucilaginibacter auburnensis]PJJ80480.1 molybdopterin-dependent oxidoreductase-like protein [Mucilaginibacter auburnensis]
MTPKKNKKPLTVDQKISRRTFISFGAFTALSASVYFSWRWLYKSPLEMPAATKGTRAPLRDALNNNEKIFRSGFSHKHLVKTYPKSMAAKTVRYNSSVGMNLKTPFNVAEWKLQINKASGEVLNLSLADIKALPKTEIIFAFKCVEGWDQISHWGGVKFADLIAHYNLQEETKFAYVAMETPDKGYYVGIDTPSATHPQTILAYEVNGKPLPVKHGAPLRLIIPVKYGIKNIKRIGSISFANERPRDYWAERGYDYYSGL